MSHRLRKLGKQQFPTAIHNVSESWQIMLKMCTKCLPRIILSIAERLCSFHPSMQC
ncbi:hypothetical protein ABIB85_008464 [Bradyrhizobium sp. JR1.5]